MQQKINPFAGRICVSLSEAAYAVLDWTPSTTRTKLCNKEYPLPFIDIDGRNVVRVSDLLEFINAKPIINNTEKRKPGRPTKRSQIERTKQ